MPVDQTDPEPKYTETHSCQNCERVATLYVAVIDIWRTADNGYAGCALLRDLFKPYVISEPRLETCSVIILFETTLGSQWHLRIIGHHFSILLEVFAERRVTPPPKIQVSRGSKIATFGLENIPRRSRILGNTASNEAIAKIQLWIAACDKDHPQCKGYFTSLPTRVLRIDGLERVALYVTNNESDHYVSLSHCWGFNKPMLQTTISTLISSNTALTGS